MKKILIIAAVVLLVGFVVAKNKHWSSYVCTASKMVSSQFKNNVSPEFEIERLKGEIARLDGDVERMIQDEANLSVDLKDLKRGLDKAKNQLNNTEKTLLDFAKDVKANPDKNFVFLKTTYTPVASKKKLTDDYELYKSLKASVQSKENLVAARQNELDTLKTQRETIVTQKLTFQAQLDQMDADWRTLKNDSHSTSPNFDTSRFTSIEEGLRNLKHKVDVEKEVIGIKSGMPTAKSTQPSVPNHVDPDTVLNAIQNPGSAPSTAEATSGQEK